MLLFSVSIKKQKMLAESKIIKTQKRMKGILIAQNMSDPRLCYKHSKHSTPMDSCNTDLLNWVKQQKTNNQRIKENKNFNHFYLWSKFLSTQSMTHLRLCHEHSQCSTLICFYNTGFLNKKNKKIIKESKKINRIWFFWLFH